MRVNFPLCIYIRTKKPRKPPKKRKKKHTKNRPAEGTARTKLGLKTAAVNLTQTEATTDLE